MRILIAPNSFKECADSTYISGLFQSNLIKLLPEQNLLQYQIISQPLSDGGDGFTEVCQQKFNCETVRIKVSNILTGQPLICKCAYDRPNQRLFVESANLIGIKLIPPVSRNPLKLNSKPVGELLKQIDKLNKNNTLKVNEVIIGIGGTATNDLGIGAASVFGLKIFDKNYNQLETLPQNFNKAGKLTFPETRLSFKLNCVTDVSNPLLGINGAAKVFAKQKSASAADIELLEAGTENILKLVDLKGKSKSELSGSGGGLAAGLELFFDAECISSKEFIIKILGLNTQKYADVIVTGEGSFDEQSVSTKAAGIIIEEFKNAGKIFICAGNFSGDCLNWKRKNIQLINISSFFNTIDESIGNIEKGILESSKIIADYIVKAGSS